MDPFLRGGDIICGRLRAITVQQPFASATIFGPRRVEPRHFDMEFGSAWVAIHAGKSTKYMKYYPQVAALWSSAPPKADITAVAGYVIGAAHFVASKKVDKKPEGDWSALPEPAEYVWEIDDVVALPTPRLHSGQLRVWWLDPAITEELVALISSHIAKKTGLHMGKGSMRDAVPLSIAAAELFDMDTKNKSTSAATIPTTSTPPTATATVTTVSGKKRNRSGSKREGDEVAPPRSRPRASQTAHEAAARTLAAMSTSSSSSSSNASHHAKHATCEVHKPPAAPPGGKNPESAFSAFVAQAVPDRARSSSNSASSHTASPFSCLSETRGSGGQDSALSNAMDEVGDKVEDMVALPSAVHMHLMSKSRV